LNTDWKVVIKNNKNLKKIIIDNKNSYIFYRWLSIENNNNLELFKINTLSTESQYNIFCIISGYTGDIVFNFVNNKFNKT
jgi:hypothetical protein